MFVTPGILFGCFVCMAGKPPRLGTPTPRHPQKSSWHKFLFPKLSRKAGLSQIFHVHLRFDTRLSSRPAQERVLDCAFYLTSTYLSNHTQSKNSIGRIRLSFSSSALVQAWAVPPSDSPSYNGQVTSPIEPDATREWSTPVATRAQTGSNRVDAQERTGTAVLDTEVCEREKQVRTLSSPSPFILTTSRIFFGMTT